MGESPVTIDGLHYVSRRLADGRTRWHVYAWRGGPSILTADGVKRPTLGPAALDKLEQARTALSAETFAGLAAAWRGSPEWAALAISTRRNWRLVLDKLETKWGNVPLNVWRDPRMVSKVVAYRDSLAATPRTADYRLTVLSALLKWGKWHGYVPINVAEGIPKLWKGAHREEIIWTAADRQKVRDTQAQPVVDAIELACLTGLRLADLATLEWANVGEHAIILTAAKRSKGKRYRVTIPIYPALASHLATLRARKGGSGHVLLSAKGKPWPSSDMLGKVVGVAVKSCGIVHDDGRKKHLHDCRGTFATEMMQAGLTDREIAPLLGWEETRVGNVRRIYVDDARVVVALAERIAANASVNRV
jgi:integrase